MADKAEEARAEEAGTEAEGQPRYALVFATARWCEPAVPMRAIFDELVRDLERRVVEARRSVASLTNGNLPVSNASPPAGSDSLLTSVFSHIAGVRGVILDVDEVDAVFASRADDAASGRPPDPAFELDPLISPAFAETIDFVPMIVLVREGNRSTEDRNRATEGRNGLTDNQNRLTNSQNRPTEERHPLQKEPNSGVNRREAEGGELVRFAGQLPKLHIRDRILEALGDDLLPPAA